MANRLTLTFRCHYEKKRYALFPKDTMSFSKATLVWGRPLTRHPLEPSAEWLFSLEVVMAWTEQCKIAFSADVENRMKREKISKRQAIRSTAKAGNIPIKTGERWAYGRKLPQKRGTQPPKKPKKSSLETCTIEDLHTLIGLDKKFSTIYADPPWSYSNRGTRGNVGDHYECLTLEEIKDLPISKLATDNAHLHLWTTNAFLPSAIELMGDWGFEYKGVFVWVKPQMGMGNYWRVSHEFLLLGVRGKLRFYVKNQKSWIEAKRGKHSAKPDRVRNTIEKVSPGPYLELFGRNTVPHWTVWGDQIERDLFYGKVD